MAALTLAQLDTQLRQLMADNRPGPQEYSPEITYKAINWAVVEMCKRNSFSYKENSFAVSAAGLLSMPTPTMSIVRVLPVQMTVIITTPNTSTFPSPINLPVSYAALAVTGISGSPADGPYSYTWTWDDGTGQTIGQSVLHTWTTTGNHLATVLAKNTNTNATASTTVTLKIVSTWFKENGFHLPYVSGLDTFGGLFSGPAVLAISATTALVIGTSYYNDATFGNNCYIYDSVAHTLKQTGSLPAGRTDMDRYQAVVMKDGRILLTGAYVSGNGSTQAFIYTPSLGTWAAAASRNTAAYHDLIPCKTGTQHGALVVLNSGKVLSVMRTPTGQDTEIYDPVANTWTTAAASPFSQAPSAFLVPSTGNVVAGSIGSGGGGGGNSMYSYNPTANTWTAMASPPSPTSTGQPGLMAILGNGQIIGTWGGISPPWQYAIYDPIANSWGIAQAMPAGMANYPKGLSALSDGRVACVVYDGGSTIYQDVWVYDYIQNTWTQWPSMVASHFGGPVLSLSGELCVFGAVVSTGLGEIEYLN